MVNKSKQTISFAFSCLCISLKNMLCVVYVSSARSKSMVMSEVSRGSCRPASPSLHEGALKAGWLKKQRSIMKNWQLRWFVLRSDQLYFYKDEEETKPQVIFQPRSHTTENSQRVAKLKAGALLFGRRDYIYIMRCSFLLEDGTADSCSSNIWSLMCSWIHEKPSCKWFDLKLLFSLSVWVREGEKTNLGLSNQSMSSSLSTLEQALFSSDVISVNDFVPKHFFCIIGTDCSFAKQHFEPLPQEKIILIPICEKSACFKSLYSWALDLNPP